MMISSVFDSDEKVILCYFLMQCLWSLLPLGFLVPALLA